MFTQKIPQRVIEARVRRTLAREGQVLRKPRSEHERSEFGQYLVVDAHTGSPDRWHCDLSELAHECGALRSGEAIEQ
jgi:hypothetical protein